MAKGEWRELYIRVLLFFGILDLKTATTEELGLAPEISNPYSDTGREYLQQVLASFKIKDTDAIIDFGCGKGGALITLSEYPFCKVTGVEISEALIEVAQKNLTLLGIDKVNLVCIDAKEFKDLDEYNYFYFFNPFPCSIMRLVIENLKNSLKRRMRRVTIIYLNPICHSVLTEDGLFAKYAEYDQFDNKFFVYTQSANAGLDG